MKPGGPTRIGLYYPNPYHVAMSLGYQVIYRMMNERPFASAERIMLPALLDSERSGGNPSPLRRGRRSVISTS